MPVPPELPTPPNPQRYAASISTPTYLDEPPYRSDTDTNTGNTTNENLSVFTHHFAETEQLQSAIEIDESDIDEEDLAEMFKVFKDVLITLVLPQVAKYFGRRFSFWAWTRFIEWYYQPSLVSESGTERSAREQRSNQTRTDK
ncbi:1827_t:CDS:2 [Paraglomus occultum]|uniref:1827_t:CDS:1 n=1 Tax=Paraglomus occultum TaxID=144539 RepID=A0A9N9F4A9_9GLOM|nr:1827_t:CDS:2 [Paraglomus occultum]